MNTKHLLAFLCFACLATRAFSQGSLTPPAAPTPTMKKLDEIEPRTNLQATPAPAGVDTTNASYHFIINQPGSYYLSANLAVSKSNGIQINAEGVTLDLNGFQISRASGSGGNGIEIPATSHRASIRSGSIKSFANGIQSLFSTNYARGCAFHDLAVTACTNAGILAGEGAVLEDCRAHANSGTYGIFAGSGSYMSHCTASGNSASYGLAINNGIISSCTSTSNTQIGIYVLGATVSGCSASNNGLSGIYINGGRSEIIGNSCRSNNNTNDINHAGIYVNDSLDRIEGNYVAASGFAGIAVVGGISNIVVKNMVYQNAANNYVISGSQIMGPIISTTGTISETNPWANFSF